MAEKLTAEGRRLATDGGRSVETKNGEEE